MPFGTITSTESTFGSISGSIVGAVPGTLSGSVGVPGPQGIQGPVGPQGPQGVPGVGGAWGTLTGTLSAQTDLWTALGNKYDVSNPAGYLNASAAGALYAPISLGLPTGGTVGQVLTKNSGTAGDASFQTLIPGDRYVTTSTTSNSVSNGAKTFTVGTGLSYSSQQDVVISYDAANHMHAVVTSYNSGTGALVVDVKSHTGSGTYASWTVNVGGTTPLQTVEWGEILGVLGDQSDLATALNAKLETSTAASTYAALSGATFTGEIVTPASTTSNAGLTITPGVAPSAPSNGEIWATTNDLQVRLNGVTETVAEQSWVTAQGYLTSAPVTSVAGRTGAITLAVGDVSGAAALAGATFTGLVGTVASTTTTAGLNIPHGTAPTTPVNGDVWTTTSGLFWRQNGSTKQTMNLGDTQTVSGNITFSNASLTLGNSTAASTYNLGTGATLNATTKAINIGTAGVSGSTTNITIGSAVAGALGTTTINGNITATGTTLNLGNSTAASTINLGTGATLTATTKAVNIGTNGVAGSTTNIAIGSTTGTSTTTLQGTTNGVTQSAGDSSLKLATTAFVTTADNLKANLASPTFTGVPAAPTATAGTNTTQIATTAFVTAAVPAIATFSESQQLASTTKVMSPFDVLLAMMTEGYRPALGMTGGSTGTGAGVNPIMPQYMGIGGPNAGVAGSCHAITNNFGAYSTSNSSGVTIAWNKPVCLSGTFAASGASVGDANNEFKLFLGPSMLNGNDPNAAAIGLWKLGGTSTISVMVHNGTTLTKVASAGTYSGTNPIRYLIYSDGAGNVTLYINGTQVATTALGPTSAYSNVGQFTASILQNASAATKYYIELVHPKIFVAPQ